MKIFHIILLIFFLNIFSCKEFNKIFGTDSYSYAQKYNIRNEENNVIEQIEQIKLYNNLEVPKFQLSGEDVILDDKRKSHWYEFYIYLKDKDQILHFSTRFNDVSKSTTLSLIGVRNGLGLGNWKIVNKDLSEEKNNEIKKVFEEQIVSKIKN